MRQSKELIFNSKFKYSFARNEILHAQHSALKFIFYVFQFEKRILMGPSIFCTKWTVTFPTGSELHVLVHKLYVPKFRIKYRHILFNNLEQMKKKKERNASENAFPSNFTCII